MKFSLIDRVLELDRGRRIVAVKAVSLAEEYLADHFPTFPVLPGVLMLEAMAQAGAWLVREAQGFGEQIILLREAKNVTYKSFVRPGQLLRLEVTCRRLAADASDFEGVGLCQDREVVRARFGLVHLSPEPGGAKAADRERTTELRAAWARLCPPVWEPAESTAGVREVPLA